ncbi:MULTISPECIES: hypothetical protein [unclassified Microbacterium]|uniref:hypothetical protein n=1 Tax=unclassified Microbacterium TaxID=2609290 RepID=UPI00386CC419
MGRKGTSDPDAFANELGAYFKHVIATQTSAVDGRWLAEASGGARGREYWRKRLAGTDALTTNDIDILAKIFDVSPFDFVRWARLYAEGKPTPELSVGPHAEDYEISEDPGEYGLAAKKRPNPGD